MRAAKFIPRKQWFVCGADDMMIRVFNYNTMDKVKQFEAHTDYIRWGEGVVESVVESILWGWAGVVGAAAAAAAAAVVAAWLKVRCVL